MKFSTLYFSLVLLIISAQSRATHIVGGEFELVHTRGIYYTLTLKMYFDELNGNPTILTNPSDQSLTASIYSKKTNALIKSVILSKTSTSSVSYTNPLCSFGSPIKTLSLVFTNELTLPPSQFNDSDGYYVVWERCCRNGVINNIIGPGDTGQVFYLEFPAVIMDGKDFYNSSPTLFPPLSDYACRNRPFYYDFSGKDPDNDSLVYSLVEPLAGSSSPQLPLPSASPRPYQTVRWETGINLNNVVPGNPTLSIDPKTGFLFVLPTKTGLFVFAVKCEEYRNKKKIGEVRRDFQMFVKDGCVPNDPPVIKVTPPPGKPYTTLADTTFVDFMIGEGKCFKFNTTDPQSKTNVTVDVKAMNFDNSFINPTRYVKYLSTPGDILPFEICFPDCPLKDDQPYIVRVISKDDGCPLPLLDTAYLKINVERPPNQLAKVLTNLSSNTFSSTVGNPINFTVSGNDSDALDSLSIKAIPIGFKFKDVETLFQDKEGIGSVSSGFSWFPKCDFLNLREKDEYEIKFILEETTVCKIVHKDSLIVKIKLESDPNLPPIIDIDRPIDNNTIKAFVGQQINFNVTGTDPDNKYISLMGAGKDFNFEDVGITFANMEGAGSVTSPFAWTILCEHLKDQDVALYPMQFVTYDKSCFGKEYDTVSLTLQVQDLNRGEKDFLPPNIFTPNGDDKNEAFSLENISVSDELPTTFSLPVDICGDKFEGITIINRWGKIIFKDNKRDFKWDAKGFPAGTYFYTIQYTKRVYKGALSVLF